MARPHVISDGTVRAIRAAAKAGDTSTSIARRYGLSRVYVSQIVARKKRATVPDIGDEARPPMDGMLPEDLTTRLYANPQAVVYESLAAVLRYYYAAPVGAIAPNWQAAIVTPAVFEAADHLSKLALIRYCLANPAVPEATQRLMKAYLAEHAKDELTERVARGIDQTGVIDHTVAARVMAEIAEAKRCGEAAAAYRAAHPEPVREEWERNGDSAGLDDLDDLAA